MRGLPVRQPDRYNEHVISVDEVEVERKIECEFCYEQLFRNDEDYREDLKIHLQEWKSKSTRMKKPKSFVNEAYGSWQS